MLMSMFRCPIYSQRGEAVYTGQSKPNQEKVSLDPIEGSFGDADKVAYHMVVRHALEIKSAEGSTCVSRVHIPSEVDFIL